MLFLLAALMCRGAPEPVEGPEPWDPLRVLAMWPDELPESDPWTYEQHLALQQRLYAPLLPIEPPAQSQDIQVDPDRWNEIVVWGERVQVARQMIRRRMQSMGYRGKRRNGGTMWVPTGKENRWRTHVFIDDDGWYQLNTPAASFYDVSAKDISQRAPTTNTAPGFQRSPPVFGAQSNFRMAGKRVRMQANRRMSAVVHPLVTDLRNAIADEASNIYLGSLLDTLEALWYDGVGYYGEHLQSTDERVEALLVLWATRTHTSAGEAARRQVADFLTEEVLPEHPVSSSRLRAAEERCGCELK